MSAGPKGTAIPIKSLVEFAAKTGSLDRRFTPAPSGQEGIEGHQLVQQSRAEGYQKELSLKLNYEDIVLRGRADGYDPSIHCIEEIKTFYGDIDTIPANHNAMHWAQAKCYGWMYCIENNCNEINVALIYFNLHEEKEYRTERLFTLTELKLECESLVKKYLDWHRYQQQRKKELCEWIDRLAFPYSSMHTNQRHLAEMVYKSAATGRTILAEAPTGTGKTLATLFPAIKALQRTRIDKIFYLTGKSTAKHIALDAIRQIIGKSDSAPIRILELTAQEKQCLQAEIICTGESCPYAHEFYEKLHNARLRASQIEILDNATLTALAQEYQICPFYLGMEMARWVDITIADINYFFDGSPLLQILTKELNWQPCLLVDESHNLIERGRQMYSAQLSRAKLSDARKQAPDKIKKSLDKISRQWKKLTPESLQNSTAITFITKLPEQLIHSLQLFNEDYLDLLQRFPDHPLQKGVIKEFYFDSLAFLAVNDILSEDFCIDLQGKPKEEVLTLRNLIPAKPLAERLKSAHSACFFSATLTPFSFYQAMLGLPDNTVHLKLESNFNQDQLDVHVCNAISTRYKERSLAIQPIIAIIRQQLNQLPGNALVFFSSYEFLSQVEGGLELALANSNIKLIKQSRNMSEQDRQTFIEQFTQHRNILGLAVLGGAFSEGIDLPGDALKGVFVATLGLPQVNPINEHMQSVLQSRFGQGYAYTYTYPGIQKVIQAAGRVIRNTQDKGYLWLLDDRYCRKEIQSLLPEWWHIKN